METSEEPLYLVGVAVLALVVPVHEVGALTPPAKTLRQRIMETEAIFLGTVSALEPSSGDAVEVRLDAVELIGSQVNLAPQSLILPGYVEADPSGEVMLWSRHMALVEGERYLFFLGTERFDGHHTFSVVPMQLNGSHVECDRRGSLLYSVSMASLQCWRPEMVHGAPQNVSRIAHTLGRLWEKVKGED